MVNAIVIFVLLIAIGFAIRAIIKSNKNGCGCGCAGCPNAESCNKKTKDRGACH